MGQRFASVDALLDAAGTDLGWSSWHEITQERINLFADATGDHQWIHVDLERARTGPFGGTIAHGYLTLSLAAPIVSELLQVDGASLAINYGLNRVRFPAPVPAGAKLRAAARLVSATRRGPLVETVIELTYELDRGGKPPCVAEVVVSFG